MSAMNKLYMIIIVL